MSTYQYVPPDVWGALDELRAVVGPVEIAPLIRQAVDIAKAGGITDERLYAMLHLANTRLMTPTTERVLTDAGIDTTPWAVVTGAQKMVPADAIVIDRAGLPEVIIDREWIEVDGQTFALEGGTDGLQRVILRYVSAIEYLTTRPQTPPVDEADVETLAGLVDDAEAAVMSATSLARRLLATGHVRVTK